MGKTTKVWLIMAIVFILLGCIIFGSVLIKLNFDFAKLGTVKYEENAYTITDTVKNISINTNTADIIFKSGNEFKVVCYEETKANHTVKVKDNELVISFADQRKWYEKIGVGIGTTKITVYLPQEEYEYLTINESTGDIKIPKNLKFQNIYISASTGDVECFSSVSKDLKIKLSTGDIDLEDVLAKTINLTVSTGDIELDRCDAEEIYINTTTGDIEGSLLSEKVFLATTDTGEVNVPKTTSGGKCEITTDTGDIEISLAK